MNNKILLVDESIQKAYTGMDALKMCKEFQPDVVVLDVMLPDIDGIKKHRFCRNSNQWRN